MKYKFFLLTTVLSGFICSVSFGLNKQQLLEEKKKNKARLVNNQFMCLKKSLKAAENVTNRFEPNIKNKNFEVNSSFDSQYLKAFFLNKDFKPVKVGQVKADAEFDGGDIFLTRCLIYPLKFGTRDSTRYKIKTKNKSVNWIFASDPKHKIVDINYDGPDSPGIECVFENSLPNFIIFINKLGLGTSFSDRNNDGIFDVKIISNKDKRKYYLRLNNKWVKCTIKDGKYFIGNDEFFFNKEKGLWHK